MEDRSTGDSGDASRRAVGSAPCAVSFEKRRFLDDLVRYFIVFEDDGARSARSRRWRATTSFMRSTWRLNKPCAPRQCRTPEVGKVARIAQTADITLPQTTRDAKPGDHRIGVIWHTQGSGKSLTMAFYAGRSSCIPPWKIPPSWSSPTATIWTINSLAPSHAAKICCAKRLYRLKAATICSKLLQVPQPGGVVFTTIQKFLPQAGSMDPAYSRPPQHCRHCG